MTNFLSFALVAGLHKLFALSFLLGLIFFVVWALRSLKKDQLKKLSIILLAIGIVGCLLIMAFGGFGLKAKKGFGKFHPGIWKCMEDDVCRAEMDSMMELRGFK